MFLLMLLLKSNGQGKPIILAAPTFHFKLQNILHYTIKQFYQQIHSVGKNFIDGIRPSEYRSSVMSFSVANSIRNKKTKHRQYCRW